MTSVIYLFLVATFTNLYAAEGASTGSNYKAAVFEHRPRHDPKLTSRQFIDTTLGFYKRAAAIAAEKDVDILVFHEYALLPYDNNRDKMIPYLENVPDPTTSKHNPCVEKETFQDRVILSTISCLARKHQMYIVANLGNIQPCNIESQTCDADDVTSCTKTCPSDGVFMYNANVVFDKAGNLIAKYHKVHPYFEAVNVPDKDEFVYFETSFGRFGLIICFDSMWKEAVVLAKDYGVDTIIFPLLWFDEINPLNAVEWQQSWALANKVNFLAANGHEPSVATLGSGIYSKDSGALVYTYDPDGESKLLVAHLSGKASDAEIIVINEDGHYVKEEIGEHFKQYCDEKIVGPVQDPKTDYRCFKFHFEKYNLVKLEKSRDQLVSCDDGFCCSLSYTAKDMQENYFLAVKNYTNDMDNFYHWCEETCMLIRCDPSEEKPCALQTSISTTVFSSFEMKANFTAERVYGTVTKNNYRLAPMSEWRYKTKKGHTELKFKDNSNAPLLKAGLFGRCYHRDPPFHHSIYEK